MAIAIVVVVVVVVVDLSKAVKGIKNGMTKKSRRQPKHSVSQ